MQFKAFFVFSALFAATASTTGALPTALEVRDSGNVTVSALTQFTLTVSSTSPNVEQLMIVLNPNLIAPHGVNYQDYFPVAWEIMRFTANSPLLGKPKPIAVSYASGITAIIQSITSTNIVNSADYQPVTTAGEEFEIHGGGGLPYSLVPNSKIVQGSSAAIFNPLTDSFPVGLGDSGGNSYLTMPLPPKDTLAFTFDAEFAVVPIGPTVQDSSKLVSGSVLRPWFSFKLSDVQTGNPSFSFDGLTITDATGLRITNHGSDEVVFGGGSASARAV